MKLIKKHTNSAFTIVELLVVIVVIGILAAILFVAYTGVSQRAISASLQSDLSTASKRIKLFQIENSAYPNSLTDCPTPAPAINLCIKLSSGNSYVGYAFNNSSNPQTYSLIAGNGNVYYKVTSSTALTKLNPTTQPGVTPGATLELHAAKANNGTGPGNNSPLTTTWKDTSGNGNNGTLNGFAGTPWAGAGTPSDPYRLVFDGGEEVVAPQPPGVANSLLTAEVWFKDVSAVPYNSWIMNFGPLGGITDWGNNGGIGALIYGTGGAGYKYTWPSGYDLRDGLLHHAVLVMAGGWMDLYIDGSSIATVDIATDFVPAELTRVLLGYRWNGSVSVARIYPFALTPEQVAQNYAAGPDW